MIIILWDFINRSLSFGEQQNTNLLEIFARPISTVATHSTGTTMHTCVDLLVSVLEPAAILYLASKVKQFKKNQRETYRVNKYLGLKTTEIITSDKGSLVFTGHFDGKKTTIYASLYFLMGRERVFKISGHANMGLGFATTKLDQKVIRFTADNMTQSVAICCSFKLNLTFYVEDVTYVETQASSIPRQDSLVNDFAALWADEDTKDVVFMVESKPISAHRLILSARSLVFKRMFQAEMVEKYTRMPIELKDVSADAFVEFLMFIYCNGYKLTTNLERELLYLADRYDVEGLKDAAANMLLKKMDVSNAIDTMILFDRHRVPKLNIEVAKFIVNNKEQLWTNAKMKKLRATHPHLYDIIDLAMNFSFNRNEDLIRTLGLRENINFY